MEKLENTLQDRVDLKFIFQTELLNPLLEELKPYYNCVNINDQSIRSYKNLYFDTPELLLYQMHHNGHLNRIKVRYRGYEDTGACFLEVKKKLNSGRTIKRRMQAEQIKERFNQKELDFLTPELNLNPNTLKPIVWINYERITMIHKFDSERITFDIRLRFNSQDSVNENIVIAELKQDRHRPSYFKDLLKKNQIYEQPISKYCLAISTLNNTIKQNNFKALNLSLNKINNHAYPTSHN